MNEMITNPRSLFAVPVTGNATSRFFQWLELRVVIAVAALFAGTTFAAEPKGHTGTEQSTRLYTQPDSSAGGGIKFRINRIQKNLLHAFAIPQFETRFVYKGVTSGGDSVSFTGLPAAKYDIVLVFEDSFYEGCKLSRDEDRLTAADKEGINAKINKSIPFFNLKEVHRLSGTTGSDGQAMCVLQEMRTKPVTLQSGEVRSDIQIRSIKLVMLDQVGPGWSVTQTREIIRQEVAGNERKGPLPHHFAPPLGGIRVTDSVKDLGLVDLTKF